MLSNSAYIIGMTSLPCLAARIFHDNPSITIDINTKIEREFGAMMVLRTIIQNMSFRWTSLT